MGDNYRGRGNWVRRQWARVMSEADFVDAGRQAMAIEVTLNK